MGVSISVSHLPHVEVGSATHLGLVRQAASLYTYYLYYLTIPRRMETGMSLK